VEGLSLNAVMREHGVRAARIAEADLYLEARTGKYEWRAVRYRAALEAMRSLGLDDSHTVMDVGAGWTELDHCLRVEGGWRGRYVPIDAGHDGTDLEHWTSPRPADFFVALEVVEHVRYPGRLIGAMQMAAARGVILSTPNPETTDVLGMDATHKVAVGRSRLESHGFDVSETSFYGQPADSLFAVWTPGARS
jgi:hypothetical protein